MLWGDDPLLMLGLSAALIALATTPIAFVLLSRREWFQARRGRVLRRPEFWSVVCGMALVMGIPAIFAALVIKSPYFDKNRYEFDPNKTWSVLEQGRGYHTLAEADEAVKVEMARLAEERKNLVNSVKKLDEAMLALRAVSASSPQVTQVLPTVLQRLGAVRRSVGVDAPQQLIDETAPPVDIAAVIQNARQMVVVQGVAPVVAASVPASGSGTGGATAGGGLTKGEVDAEIAAVPEPQRKLAAMLPLLEVPKGWKPAKSGTKFIETFDADNLYEKIDGRAESFVDFNVKGMAYASFVPDSDPTNDVQVFIFELGDDLKAYGKYGTEKPTEAQQVKVGNEGYVSAGSLLFYAGPYYTQIVSTRDDPEFAKFSLAIASLIAAQQGKPPVDSSSGGSKGPAAVAAASKFATPDAMFAVLPPEPGRSRPNYVPQDAFGYGFLSDAFIADYVDKDVKWQAFVRPYRDAAAALAVFNQYVESAKLDNAKIDEVKVDGADKMVVCSNIGMVDVVFLKGNVFAGANGASDAAQNEAAARARALAFASSFAKSLPSPLPPLEKEASGAQPKPKPSDPKTEPSAGH